MKQVLTGFKQFIFRGNVVDLAVGIAIGASFNTVVSSLVKDLITPLATLLGFGKRVDFASVSLRAGPATFAVGDFLNALISFCLLAIVVYFCVVLPMNLLVNRVKRHEVSPDPTTKKCPECLSDIPKAARRCAFCTVSVL